MRTNAYPKFVNVYWHQRKYGYSKPYPWIVTLCSKSGSVFLWASARSKAKLQKMMAPVFADMELDGVTINHRKNDQRL